MTLFAAQLAASPLPLDMSGWDILLCLSLFGMTATATLAIFGQAGQVKMSPQREAAIATGHTDRKTAFENPAFRPLLWLLLVVAHRLAVPRLKAWLRTTLVSAGSPNYYTSEEYLALSMSAGLVLAGGIEIMSLLASGGLTLFGAVIAVLLGTGLALYQLQEKAARRVRDISRQVPYALDLIALAMGAGATFVEAVRTVTARRSGEDPFNIELKTLLAEMELGATRRKALQNLSDRIPLDSLRTIIASVVQAEELGTPLAVVLHDQATLLRMRRSMNAENRAAIASVRILVPCLLLVMAVILTIFGPTILRVLQGGLL